MDEFLRIALTFPPAIFTACMLIVAIYWIFVVVGVLDIEFFDIGGAAEGAIDGAIDGAVEGAIDGAMDGVFDGAMEAAGEGGAGILTSVFSALNLRDVPVTISFSAFTLFAWMLTFAGVNYLEAPLGSPLPLWASVVLLPVATVLALLAASVVVRPLRPVFQTHTVPGRAALVGSTCIVTTGEVDEGFGQGEYNDGGAGLILALRADTPNNISRGDKVLLIDYDPESNTFQVESMDSIRGPKPRDVEFDFDSLSADDDLEASSAATSAGASSIKG